MSSPVAVSRWTIALRVFAIATLLAALQASQHYVGMRVEEPGTTWWHAIVQTVPFWYNWALFAPLVAWFGRRLPIERDRLVLRVLAHLGLAATLGMTHNLLHTYLLRLTGEPYWQESFWTKSVNAGLWGLFLNVLAYGTVLGVTYAMDYQRRLRERELESSRLAAQLAEARVQALRMQLNPHFLFNTMNSIAMLVRSHEDTQAVRMVAGLSDLLRDMLDDSRPAEVRLRDELAFIERYLAIEQVRFQDRLEVRVDADAVALDALVPSLVLQPLVENAVRHGIARRASAGLIEITARRANGTLTLAVRDDGPGVAAAPEPPALPSGGVGLRNTRARLAQLYGDDQRVTLTGAPGGGALATVTIPYRPAAAATESGEAYLA